MRDAERSLRASHVIAPMVPGAIKSMVVVPEHVGLGASFAAVDLVTGKRFAWKTGGNYVGLGAGQAHVLRV